MVKKTFYINESEWNKAKEKANSEGLPLAYIARTLIKMWTEEKLRIETSFSPSIPLASFHLNENEWNKAKEKAQMESVPLGKAVQTLVRMWVRGEVEISL